MSRQDEPEKKKYNTKELLSLNMDRLKEYMEQMGKQAEDQASPPMFEVPKPRGKSTTRIGKSPASCRVLALFGDPHAFVQVVAENDARPRSRRYVLERTGSFEDATRRLDGGTYDFVVAGPMDQEIPDVEAPFTALDWVLLLRGLMPKQDVYFLAKKRWFVMNLIQGNANPQKVENFRKIKEAYAKVPFLFLASGERPEERCILESAPKVRVLPPGDLGALFTALDGLTLGTA